MITKNKCFSLLWIFLFLSSFSFPALAVTKIQDFSDASKPILLKEGMEVFSISLKANPTTGYIWFLKSYKQNLLIPLSKTYVVDHPNMVGSGGIEKWIFKIKPYALTVPQVSKIVFLYARPWDLKDNPTIVTFDVVLH